LRICRPPVARAPTVTQERHCGHDNPDKDDSHSDKFEPFGKLIDEGVNLFSEHATLLAPEMELLPVNQSAGNEVADRGEFICAPPNEAGGRTLFDPFKRGPGGRE